MINKLVDVVDQFPWLSELSASQRWCWVAMVCWVSKHCKAAGVVKDIDWTPDEWARKLDVPVHAFCAMRAVAYKHKAIRRTTGCKGDTVVACLAHPIALSPSTIRVRKHRGKVVHTLKECRDTRTALRVRGLATPTRFSHAWYVGANLMAQHGIIDVHVKLMRHWLSEKGKAPSCRIQWLNSFVGSLIGQKVNLTTGIDSRRTVKKR